MQQEKMKKYLTDHIDRAISEGWIRVYYQPVVRAMSGALCGFEALARWQDPEQGLLSPAVFIPVLEKSKQITRLDLYVIREICRKMRQDMDAEKNILPVSFNLSRLDFLTCDIFQEVEQCVREWNIPRDLVHVEITESLLMQDEEVIENAVKAFHKAGYQIWMDDFGSGFSSLNVLKDFEFDELKIDMVFLSRFTKRSRNIITSVVDMAKKLGIQTLAEGVETREQFEFLKNIGCEKIQGYLFGKPEPYADSLRHCREEGLKMETPSWRNYYDEVGRVNLLTDRSLALVEDDGKEFRFRFANDSYREVLKSAGTDTIGKAFYNTNSPLSPMARRFREFIAKPAASGKEEVLNYLDNDSYLRIFVKLVAENRNHRMYRVSIMNLSRDMDVKKTSVMDKGLRLLYHIYDEMYLLDLGEDRVEVLYENANFQPVTRYGINKIRKLYVDRLLFPADRERFLAFTAEESLQERVAKTGKGFVTDYFRVREGTGDYLWKVYTIMAVPKSADRQWVLFSRISALNDSETADTLWKNFYGQEAGKKNDPEWDISDGELLQNLLESEYVKFFWKDRERKFRGASRGFLNYYGLSSVSEILGKTDEEMKWHVSGTRFAKDEERVLHEGIHTRNVPGKCIARGQERDIVASKMPVYKNGKIIGIAGFFYDVDSILRMDKQAGELEDKDLLTDTLNARGMIRACLEYEEDFRFHQRDFAEISVGIRDFRAMTEDFGEDFRDALLKRIAEGLRTVMGNTGIIGRISGEEFLILYQFDARDELTEIEHMIRENLLGIHQVNGHSCTIYAGIGISVYSDFHNLEKMFQHSASAMAETHYEDDQAEERKA